jgi:Flp pilus assembly pilin Flp
MMIMSKIRYLLKDQNGTSVMEFGLIAPVAVMMMFGTMDVGYTYYVRSVLDGAMQNVARDSSLEGATTSAQQAAMNKRIEDTVRAISRSAEVKPQRRYYKTFSDAAAAKAEEFTDTATNLDGLCNNGEPYIDANRNGEFDEDGGDEGQGGAQDVVVIKYRVRFARLFPMGALIGLPNNVTIYSNSILANQPYGEQAAYGVPLTGNCDEDEYAEVL